MKINVVSDLHLEFYPKKALGYLKDVLKDGINGVDVLVVPGDILTLVKVELTKEVFALFCKEFKHVVYIPGNHEYYGISIGLGNQLLQDLQAQFSNLHILDINKPVTIEGQRFLGAAMWFPYDPLNIVYERMLNDFRYIKDITPYVYDHNKEFTSWLSQTLEPTDVVVTHHLPTYESVPDEYKVSQTNRFFVSNQETLIMNLQPKLWIHGHTHNPCDYLVGTTRVIANPIGYYPEFKITPQTFWKIVEL
jgi:Icc-related predicted phosphoesterase